MIALSLSLALAGTFDDYESATDTSGKVDALFEVIADESLAEEHGVAWGHLGAELDGADLEGAALIAWSKSFAAGGDGVEAHVVPAIGLADEVGDHNIVAEPIAAFGEIGTKDTDPRSHVAYIVARDLLRRDKLGPTLSWLEKVDGDSPDFPDAESVRGIVLAIQGKHEKALVPLQTARALGVTLEKGERFDTKILMNLARAYYGAENWGQAIYHYKQVPRDSPYWPEAHFEEAWSHFRGADMAGTIGLLQSHKSPFMEHLWFPEADMLRTQALFMMCKFGTAVEEMNRFEERYQPVLADLDGALSGLDDAGAFEDVSAYLEGRDPELPVLVLRRYRAEDRIEEARTAVGFYREEASSDLSVLGDHADEVKGWLNARADSIAEGEGERVLGYVKRERDDLEQMLTGLELARVDILQLESRLYERAAATGVLQDVTADRIGKLRELRRKKGYQVWPFEGEYWADEVGWYQVDSRSDCPESLARKIGG